MWKLSKTFFSSFSLSRQLRRSSFAFSSFLSKWASEFCFACSKVTAAWPAQICQKSPNTLHQITRFSLNQRILPKLENISSKFKINYWANFVTSRLVTLESCLQLAQRRRRWVYSCFGGRLRCLRFFVTRSTCSSFLFRAPQPTLLKAALGAIILRLRSLKWSVASYSRNVNHIKRKLTQKDFCLVVTQRRLLQVRVAKCLENLNQNELSHCVSVSKETNI